MQHRPAMPPLFSRRTLLGSAAAAALAATTPLQALAQTGAAAVPESSRILVGLR